MVRIILCLLISVNSFSQINIKRELPTLISSYIAGASEGTAEILKWHYDRFDKRFPNANQNYWNPKYSGDNKYRDGLGMNGPKYFGSTTFLVWTTDGYHLTRFMRNNMFITTLILHPKEKRNWKYVALDALLHTVAFQIGFHTTYGIIFKP